MKIRLIIHYFFFIFVIIFAIPHEIDEKKDKLTKDFNSTIATSSISNDEFMNTDNSDHASANGLEKASSQSFYNLQENFNGFKDLSDFSIFNESNGTVELAAKNYNAKSNTTETDVCLYQENNVIPKFMCLTNDILDEILPKTNFSTNSSVFVIIPQSEESNEIETPQNSYEMERPCSYSLSNSAKEYNSLLIDDHRSDYTKLQSTGKLRTSENLDPNITVGNSSDVSLALSNVEKKMFGSVSHNSFNTKKNLVELFISMKKEYKFCSNYNFFSSMIPELYFEIENDFKLNSLDESKNCKGRENNSKYFFHPEIISIKIYKYDSIPIKTDKKLNEIIIFANNLINSKEKTLPGLTFKKILQLTENITKIMIKVKNHRNLGVFYELLKFVNYYHENLIEYIEKNYTLYVYFLLSIILGKLENFDGFKTLEYKRCSLSKSECKNTSRALYLKKYFVQKLFSRLLLGFKNGLTKARFYNVYLILDLSSETHHILKIFNQNKNFKFYIRVFVSIVLSREFAPETDLLKKFTYLSIHVCALERELKNNFIKELQQLIAVTNTGYTLVKNNSTIVDICGLKKTLRGFISEAHYVLKSHEKFMNQRNMDLNVIFESELCLSWYLNQKYQNNNFEVEKDPRSWIVIYKSLKC